MRAFLFADRALTAQDVGFGEALATAHRVRTRPLCLCRSPGIAMYAAHLGSGFMLKRMPGTGSLHSLDCPSRGPPIVPAALDADATIGEEDYSTALTVDFSLTKRGPPSSAPHAGATEGRSSLKRDGLTLVGFLRYLWNEAELNRWQPSFAGRRSWATVRRRLLTASLGKTIGRRPLPELLYIPEVFTAERRREIRERRLAAWRACIRSSDGGAQLMVLVGEVKQLTPTKYGSKVVIKHVPDRAFRDERYWRRATMSPEENWGLDRSAGRHWVVVATFSADVLGTPFIEEMVTVPTNRHWVLEDGDTSARNPSAAPGRDSARSYASDNRTVNP